MKGSPPTPKMHASESRSREWRLTPKQRARREWPGAFAEFWRGSWNIWINRKDARIVYVGVGSSVKEAWADAARWADDPRRIRRA